MALNKEDNVSGFLDGYKAKNLALLEDKIFYDVIDLEKITYLLTELTKNEIKFKAENEKLTFLESNLKNKSRDILSRLIEFGSELSNFIELSSKEFKHDYMNRIKEITIKYLDICEKSNNTKLLKRALDVASRTK